MRLLVTSLLIVACATLAPLASARAGLSEGRAAYAQGDYAAALAEITPLAESGEPNAQRLLGVMYRQGQGVAKNGERALHWTQQAVAQGDAAAQFNLANIYEAGDIVAKNFALAAKYYYAAAHAGIPLAQYRLGAFYLDGLGGTTDAVLSFVWYSRAASNKRSGALADHAAKARDKIAGTLSESEKARGAALLNKSAQEFGNGAEAVDPPRKQSTGTGFIVSADGYVLTNNHVVAGCSEVRIKPLVVPIIAQDAGLDLALLKVGAKFKRFATFRDGEIRKGETVVVAGFPLPGVLASDLKITTGTVSGLAGPGNNRNLMQLSAPVQKGNSGGPLLDLSGHLVGVVVSKLDALKLARTTGDIPQNVNFAIKGSVARDFMAANGIEAVSAPSEANLPAADVAERAQFYTALIECWK
ncbi:MAG: tetratricopeptide repeat-containing serine protease family protein [Proteobacteria bacterium]|nr:tetratricopeptide repeat-containing serine protease family protein [Pseudomonadota bacterium]MDA1356243.1 tetratricopeptide repeat-containing serine protease family protein [Pseudomonadota bacterium]